jgi:glycosyltransferase involved in cell wall biosynthesis
VLAQTYPIEEIWVSDDASSDDTAEVMAEICGRHSKVHYRRQSTNLGISANLSWVLSQPSTELTVRLDSDDTLLPGYVATLAPMMSKYPDAGYAHCDIVEVDGNGMQRRIRRLARHATFESSEEAIRRNTPAYRVAANCILYRTEVLRAANYYYPNVSWRSAEDWDLCLRIAGLGWGNVFVAKPLATYRVWDDAGQLRFKRVASEAAALIEIYGGTLATEYRKRGWDDAILRKSARKRALGFVNAIDSPLFSGAEREALKQLIRKLGDSPWLSMKIFLAEMGLGPLFRRITGARVKAKDIVKSCLRAVKR